MSKPSRNKAQKKKKREKELRRARNLRRNEPTVRDDEDVLDLESALEALPIDTQAERVMRRIARATGRRRFASSEDAVAALADLDEGAKAKLRADDPRETAQDYAFLAMDPANDDVALELVDEALEIDPECVDALAMLAFLAAPDDGAQIRGIERAVMKAEMALGGAGFREWSQGDSWGDVLARPALRARQLLSNVLFARGMFAEAVVQIEVLLALDRADPLHVRASLVAALLARGDVARAKVAMEEMDEKWAPMVAWARPLRMWLEGDLQGAGTALEAARAINSLAEGRILGPGAFDLDEAGDEDDVVFEGKEIGLVMGPAWRAHPKALEWLRERAS